VGPKPQAKAKPKPKLWLAFGVVAATLLARAPAWAFDLDGHAIIEATAYKRLLALARVPETQVSGRELLAALVADGVLLEPPCFDERSHGCGPRDRLERPLAFWPILGASAADLIINRQLNASAQCQHFMAETRDGLTPPDPRMGVPEGLVTDAYTRCVRILGVALEGIARDPRLARARLVGMYSLVHAIEDSFSAAHAARDADNRIRYLLTWTLLDFPAYFQRGTASFPAETHHAVTDRRDADYLRRDGSADDGQPCPAFLNPYAVPESCLTPRARAAADAVYDLVVLVYRVRAQAAAAGRPPSISEAPEDRALWERYVSKHLASAVAPFEPPPYRSTIGKERTDRFVGLRGSVTRNGGWGASAWTSRLFFGPALPFALLLTGGAGYMREDGRGSLVAAASLGLALPVIQRFSFGFAPIGLAGTCGTSFDHCSASLTATTAVLIVPLPHSLWLTLEGPRWSWANRALSGSVFALALGRSYENDPHEPDLPPDVMRAWQPPRPEDVLAYRMTTHTWGVWFAATTGSTARNQWVTAGADLRWDRDQWNRRAGFVPLIAVAVQHGTLGGTEGNAVTLAPALGRYLLPGKLAVVLTPAALRLGAQYGSAFGADVAGKLSVALDLARVEIAVDSPALSYVSSSRWYGLPLTLRLGVLVD
jgi:hypothetical protein